jgi:hypothetical protein
MDFEVVFGLIRGTGYFSDKYGTVTVNTVLKMGREGGCVSLDVEL